MRVLIAAFLKSSPLPEKEKALFRFVVKTNGESAKITGEDVESLHAVIDDASGVHAMSEESHRQFGERTALHGYIRK
jgi:hypothetical protein